MKKKYCEKYNTACIDMRAVFNTIYTKEVPTTGICSNAVVVSGEAVREYTTKYLPNVIRNRCKAIIMEKDYNRAARLKGWMKRFKKGNIKVVRGDIVAYEDIAMVRNFIKTPARFLDLGLGIGIEHLVPIARFLLSKQLRVGNFCLKKMLIFDSSIRGVSDSDITHLLNDFLKPIGKEVVSVGKGLIGNKMYAGENGYPIKDSNARSYTTVLSGSDKRQARLNLYTYKNGSGMLTVMLSYK